MYNAGLYEIFHRPVYITAKEILSNYGHLLNWPNVDKNRSEVMIILDAGCGEGTSTINIFQQLIKKNVENYKIIGVDYSSQMILNAKEKYSNEKNCEFELMDLSLETFPEKFMEHFDLIYSMYCLHWVKTTHWIKNFYKMLKPNGQIFLTIMTENFLVNTFKMVNEREKFCKYQNATYWDNHFFTTKNLKNSLQSLLKNEGYKNITMEFTETIARFLNKETFISFIKIFNAGYEHLPTNLIEDYLNEVIEEFIKASLKLYGSSTEISFSIPIILISAEKF